MSDMQFNTEQENEFGRPPERTDGTNWAKKIVSWGLASDTKQAEYLMMGVGVLLLVIAYFLYRGLSGGDAPPLLPPIN